MHVCTHTNKHVYRNTTRASHRLILTVLLPERKCSIPVIWTTSISVTHVMVYIPFATQHITIQHTHTLTHTHNRFSRGRQCANCRRAVQARAAGTPPSKQTLSTNSLQVRHFHVSAQAAHCAETVLCLSVLTHFCVSLCSHIFVSLCADTVLCLSVLTHFCVSLC